MTEVSEAYARHAAERKTELDEIRQAARTLADKFPLSYWRKCDKEEKYPWEFVKAFAKAGWMGILVPEEYGGMGLGVTESAVMLHEIGASGAGTGGASAMHFYIFPPHRCMRHGSEEMKKKYLPAIARGELLMAFGVTEPTAGVDTSRIRTKAEKNGDGWVINGQKVWITNAQNAKRILLLARTLAARREAAARRHDAVLHRPRPRALHVREIDKLGRAAVDSNEVFIDNLEVPDEDVVGEVGKGFNYLLDGLNPERIVVGMEAIGIGRAALDMAVEVRQGARRVRPPDRQEPGGRASARRIAGCGSRPRRRWRLKAARSTTRTSRAARRPTRRSSSAPKRAIEACDRAMQTHGGYAYSKEYHVERLWRKCGCCAWRRCRRRWCSTSSRTACWVCPSPTETL